MFADSAVEVPSFSNWGLSVHSAEISKPLLFMLFANPSKNVSFDICWNTCSAWSDTTRNLTVKKVKARRVSMKVVS